MAIVFYWIPIIIIEVFDGNKLYADKIDKLDAFYLPSVVLGELYTGINRVSNKAKHLKKLNTILEICAVLNIDSTTSKYYGKLIAELYKKGKPLPTNDVWIAALALQYDFIFITNDNHFKEIGNLKFNKW